MTVVLNSKAALRRLAPSLRGLRGDASIIGSAVKVKLGQASDLNIGPRPKYWKVDAKILVFAFNFGLQLPTFFV